MPIFKTKCTDFEFANTGITKNRNELLLLSLIVERIIRTDRVYAWQEKKTSCTNFYFMNAAILRFFTLGIFAALQVEILYECCNSSFAKASPQLGSNFLPGLFVIVKTKQQNLRFLFLSTKI